VAADEDVPAVHVRVLRPLEEPLGGVVLDDDLRQPDEEPRLPAPAPGGYEIDSPIQLR
jgi:hypothetical protein